ncbi:heat shock 70 kDa protein-like [Chrysoperla carnea]|uniref:heat shock 70 kDa protein-like n=1 Tax=Chrysoperla carnea TaxID=189513 RepID=UPI001D05C451|nr:heat shock 70 kDa protein-like [Chrysoperla carnea]
MNFWALFAIVIAALLQFANVAVALPQGGPPGGPPGGMPGGGPPGGPPSGSSSLS